MWCNRHQQWLIQRTSCLLNIRPSTLVYPRRGRIYRACSKSITLMHTLGGEAHLKYPSRSIRADGLHQWADTLRGHRSYSDPASQARSRSRIQIHEREAVPTRPRPLHWVPTPSIGSFPVPPCLKQQVLLRQCVMYRPPPALCNFNDPKKVLSFLSDPSITLNQQDSNGLCIKSISETFILESPTSR